MDDWSHHRLVFSNPGTAWEALKGGRYREWLKTISDPRFGLQQIKRAAVRSSRPNAIREGIKERIEEAEARLEETIEDRREPGDDGRDLTALLPRGLAAAPASSAAERRHAATGHRRRVPPISDDWSMDMGSGASAGLGMYPAKFSFDVSTANCGTAAKPDFVVFNTSLAGAANQASILAFDNLYTGCSGTVPSTYWAYNTAGTVVTSVVLSLDGSQIAFAQSSSGGVASLVLLKWAASGSQTASSPGTPTSVSNAAYRACSAPCMTSISFSGGANDSGSAPFYDYSGTDALYIGDDVGKLHKFTGVFAGTPAETTTSPWPVSVGTSPLSSPVLDGGTGNILVGDYLLNLASTCAPSGTPCGFFHSVRASTGAVIGTSSRLDLIFGLVDGPLVDSTAGRAYVFVGADSNSGAGSPCGANLPCSGVFQFATNFTSGSGTETTLGPGNEFLLAGTFDNAYFTSANTASPTGHLYAVGSTGSANNTLYQVSINSNVMSASATTGPVLSNNFTNGFVSAGLQVTEFFDGTHDFLFLGVLSFGTPANCSGSLTNGCVMGFDVTSGTINGATTPTGATVSAGGTSGIIIDNRSAFTGASNIYYTPLANQSCPTSGTTGGCAIQVTQAIP